MHSGLHHIFLEPNYSEELRIHKVEAKNTTSTKDLEQTDDTDGSDSLTLHQVLVLCDISGVYVVIVQSCLPNLKMFAATKFLRRDTN